MDFLENKRGEGEMLYSVLERERKRKKENR